MEKNRSPIMMGINGDRWYILLLLIVTSQPSLFLVCSPVFNGDHGDPSCFLINLVNYQLS